MGGQSTRQKLKSDAGTSPPRLLPLSSSLESWCYHHQNSLQTPSWPYIATATRMNSVRFYFSESFSPESTLCGGYLARPRSHALVWAAKELGKQRPNLFNVFHRRWALITSKTCSIGEESDSGKPQITKVCFKWALMRLLVEEVRNACGLNCLFK